MPLSVRRALDELASQHPDIPKRLPDTLPPISDLEAGYVALESRLAPVEENHAKRCFARLLVTFEPTTKLGDRETRVRFAAWLEACRDIPGDLWEIATSGCCQALKWMPKPVEFRDQVREELDTRTKQVRQARDMLEAARHAKPIEPPQKESREVMLRMLIKSARTRGDMARAIHWETELAALENRELESWTTEPPARETLKRPAPYASLPSLPETQATLLRALARAHRAQANGSYAEHLEQKAQTLEKSP